VLAGIRRKHARPPVQKEAILPEDLRDMLATLPHDLRGLRDRAILLIGFAGGLRRSEIVSLDHGKDDTPDSGGWVEILEDGVLITLRGKTGWREVEIARGSSDQTCPVHALTQWLHYARIDFGPIFVAVSRNGLKATDRAAVDKHVARLIKQCVREAGLRPDLPKPSAWRLFSGHSLRAGLASSAEVDERYVQKQLGHASAEMTRRYQRRRDRFRVNLTKAAGLYLRADAALDLAQGDDAQEQLALGPALQPGRHPWRAVWSPHRRDHIGVQQIHQKATSRGLACNRSTSAPGKCNRCSAKLSRRPAATCTSRSYSSTARTTTAGRPRRVTSCGRPASAASTTAEKRFFASCKLHMMRLLSSYLARYIDCVGQKGNP
jgi:site-specific recombinase XerC